MNEHQLVVVLDFGGQYNQLIARRVRECGVYSEVYPYSTPIDTIKAKKPIGVIFTGGPASVFADDAPKCDPSLFELGVPVLGICYGQQLMGHMLGGGVEAAERREYGKTELINPSCGRLFAGVPEKSICWMSHTNFVARLPEGFTAVASTAHCETAAMENEARRLYGVQFHPEVLHTEYGKQVLENFLFSVCEAKGDWKMSSFAEDSVRKLRETIGNGRVLLALSGGVDSSVAAALLSKAVGSQLTCIFVDHGLLRKNEGDEVERVFTNDFNMHFIRANEEERFLSLLSGVSDPERKRKIIGSEFIRVFEAYAKKLGSIDFLVQGTIYPDVIESGTGDAAVIKSHHNVGGLPDAVNFKEIIEPLRLLFKDEVRALGLELGLPETLVYRQPFPGPGLAIRVIGEVTADKLAVVREADAIFREEIATAGLDRSINQYFAAMTDTKTVGVMGDERTFENVIVLRAVTTTDFMTADWVKIPYDVLERVSSRIVNEVKHTNRIVYDITSKPPSTIEWE